jgi:hypothetical protein
MDCPRTKTETVGFISRFRGYLLRDSAFAGWGSWTVVVVKEILEGDWCVNSMHKGDEG